MLCSTGQRILNRVRSHKKLQASGSDSSSHKRQDSLSSSGSRPSTDSDCHRSHYPTLEWDPLKLNPPVSATHITPRAVPPHHASFRERTLRNKRSYAGHELQQGRRHYQSDSTGSALEIHDGFDFGFAKEQAIQSVLDRNRDGAVHLAGGWPSPASSTSSSDWHDDYEDDDGARPQSSWSEASSPSPRRRPQPGPFDGPDYFLKRGGWKRRGIVFGGQVDEVYVRDDDAFDLE
ncbi:hypothetical protein NKR23_g1735 [Pleurostoma richardsiae]|uniref:Uncharacterized protein n=1 Tax=Pleurostoma richardsiae TaxID=41990 RepID=A0AA38RS12_9PEZI|nr:hypothetical protein NKR23_g1735 [Pleurostoma richardsiae]